MYVAGASRVALLSADAEITLAKEMEAARASGDDATVRRVRDHLVSANLRLGVKLAHAFHRKRSAGSQLTLEDFVQEANLGLMRAADNFDWRKGVRFTSFAAWWVRGYMERALIEQGYTISVPSSRVQHLIAASRMGRAIEKQTGTEPTTEELEQLLGIHPRGLADARAARYVVSMDAPAPGHDGDLTLADALPAPVEDDPPMDLDRRELRKALYRLRPNERDIISRRFGLEGDEPETLEQVGARYGICRERIRQIQRECLLRLRRVLSTHAKEAA